MSQVAIMIKILFIRSAKAYLPEIEAYLSYFNSSKDFRAFGTDEATEMISGSFDVIWDFKGFGGITERHTFLVHEYASLSTPPLAKIKDFLKVKYNSRPSLRVFLNEFVKSQLCFADDIPFCFRDMGIDDNFCRPRKTEKEYDFVYVGSISKSRGIDKLLRAFKERPNGKLCLIGVPEDGIYKQYKRYKDIVFTGRVPYPEVPEIASKAEYGINYIPDKYPYSMQTSTKLLEYLAMGLKIITTDYKWIRKFEIEHNCSFYKLKSNSLTFDIKEFKLFKFSSNFNAKNFLWNNIIAKSNIDNILKQLVT